MRRRREPELQLPEALVVLACAEDPAFDGARVVRRLASAGVVAVSTMGDEPSRPIGIAFATPAQGGWVDVLYDEWEKPISTALSELVEAVTRFDQLGRLHSAMIDLDLVAMAARRLVEARSEEVGTHPLQEVSETIEVGIVTMYSRAFTGNAAVGERWKPLDETHRVLHEELVALRGNVYAHADWNPQRRLVDVNAAAAQNLGDNAPDDLVFGVAYAEVREPMPDDVLVAIAELCELQYERFYAATFWMKVDLGILAAPPGVERPERL